MPALEQRVQEEVPGIFGLVEAHGIWLWNQGGGCHSAGRGGMKPRGFHRFGCRSAAVGAAPGNILVQV